jgi:hypothetical protein
MRAAFVLALTLACSTAVAEEPKKMPCSAAEYRQFDFWIGEWEVTAGGKVAGHNSITKIHGDCALREEWRGAGGGAGTSLNVYDRATKQWHQTWVDKSGLVLHLNGGLNADGAMVLEGTRLDREGKTLLERITWSRREDGAVRQLWDTKKDGKWEVAFDGTYTKK